MKQINKPRSKSDVPRQSKEEEVGMYTSHKAIGIHSPIMNPSGNYFGNNESGGKLMGMEEDNQSKDSCAHSDIQLKIYNEQEVKEIVYPDDIEDESRINTK
jgi:hypothetical protein